MGNEEIESLIRTVLYTQYVLCALVGAQIVAKLILFARVVDVLWRVEKLLGITEQHATTTDAARDRVVEKVGEVKKAVEKVPEATATIVTQKIEGKEPTP